MVTKRDGRRKGTWCASSTKNRDTLNMIFLSTKNKDKRRKKKAMIATWSENEDESSEEETEKEVANMCFMAIDELDEVNSNISDEDIHDVFQELYEDFEKLGLKNIFLKKKVQQLEKISWGSKRKFFKC